MKGVDEISRRVETPTSKRPAVFKSPLPLANPETIFTYGTWVSALNFAADYLKNQRKKFNKNLEVTIRDLYFMKVYAKPFDFQKARKSFSELGQTEFHINEPNDRDNERSLTLKIGDIDWFSLYEFHNSICFTANGAVNSDEIIIKRERCFPNKTLTWEVHSDQFLKFVDAIEKTLMGQGDPMQCRVFMEVKARNVVIAVKSLYEEPFLETRAKIWTGLKSLHRRHIRPEFTIAIT